MSSKISDLSFNITEYKKKFGSEFFIQDMDLSLWIPTYNLINKHILLNGNTVYYLRSDSEKTLFMNSFYWAVNNYMSHLGYEPDSQFLFARLNPLRKKSIRHSIYKETIHDRLLLYSKTMKYGEASRKFVFVKANFFSNDRELDLGFYFRCCSRTVELITFPYATLSDDEGKEVPPNIFFHLLLLNMKYPKYVYYYNKINGTLNRLVREYPDLVNQTNKYKKWGFNN